MSSDSTRGHEAVLVQVGSWKAEIDCLIAPLIQEMWIAGIETMMSCQEDIDGRIWIEFPDLDDLTRFLDITAVYEAGAETLYNRMNYLLPLDDPSSCWDYGLFPCDMALVWPAAEDKSVTFRHEGLPGFFFTSSVRFPQNDLAPVMQRLQEHNRRQDARIHQTDGAAETSASA